MTDADNPASAYEVSSGLLRHEHETMRVRGKIVPTTSRSGKALCSLVLPCQLFVAETN